MCEALYASVELLGSLASHMLIVGDLILSLGWPLMLVNVPCSKTPIVTNA
jgi:hypothetical protein